MDAWLGWTLLSLSALNIALSGLRVAQNERLWRHHLRLASPEASPEKKGKKKKGKK